MHQIEYVYQSGSQDDRCGAMLSMLFDSLQITVKTTAAFGYPYISSDLRRLEQTDGQGLSRPKIFLRSYSFRSEERLTQSTVTKQFLILKEFNSCFDYARPEKNLHVLLVDILGEMDPFRLFKH